MYIHGMGHYHPNNVIDNAFLESLNIGTNDEWITSRVGIKERRTTLDLNYIKDTHNKNPELAYQNIHISAHSAAAIAAENALKQAGLSISDIGMVLAGSCAPEYSVPATACLIAAELGIEAPSFDLSSACSTFAAQMHFIDQMDTDKSPDYILLIQSEHWTKTVDYRDRTTAVLVGDGVAATIVSKKHPARFNILHTTLSSYPDDWQKVQTPGAKHFIQDGRAVQKFAVRKTVSTFESLQTKTTTPLNQHYFISHQANLTMLQSVCKKLSIPENKHFYNIDKFGNTAASGAPTVMSQNFDAFKAGDFITLVVVGAGLSWGGMVIEVNG